MVAYKIVGFLFVLNVMRTSTFVSPDPDEMIEAKIVPDIIPIAPPQFLMVSYPSGMQVNFGDELKPEHVKDEPQVKWNVNPFAFYTLCMLDADSPTTIEPALRSWLHWLVGNIPADKVHNGETIAEYIGVFPLRNTGSHRYVFLLYKQPKRLVFDEKRRTNKSMLGRAEFNVTEFAHKYNLGNPFAGNFFKAQWDEYADRLHGTLDKRPELYPS